MRGHRTLNLCPLLLRPAAATGGPGVVVAPALTGVGENFEGGLAEVTAVDAARGTVDVRLTIGGARQRGIAASRVAAFALDAPRRRRQTAGRCRLFGCACLIVDCGHAQPDELAAAPRAPADARARRDLEAAAQALGLERGPHACEGVAPPLRDRRVEAPALEPEPVPRAPDLT